VTVADDPVARPLPQTPIFDEEVGGPAKSRGGRSVFRRGGYGRAIGKIVRGAVAAALIAGPAAGIIWKRDALQRTWNSIRHHSLSHTWNDIRTRSASAVLALRRRIPIEALQPDDRDEGSAHDSTSKGTHRRSHPAKNKKSRGDHALASK
jgi:hypothetical protein